MQKNFKLLIYFLGVLRKYSTSFLPLSILIAIVQGISPLIIIIVPKLIIDELLGQKNVQTLLILIAGLGIANLILKMIEITLDRIKSRELESIQLKISESLADKCIHLRYEDIEKKSILDLKERAFYGVYGYFELVDSMGIAGKSLITLISVVALLFTFNPWVVLILTGLTLLNSIVYKRISDFRYRDSIISIPSNRGFSFFGSLASDFSFGKDIRLSQSADFLQGKAGKYLDDIIRIWGNQYTEIGKLTGITAINMQFQSFLVYGWLAWNAIRGFLTIGDLTMYGSAARHFTRSLTELVNSLISINGLCMHIEPYKEFISLSEVAEDVNTELLFSVGENEPMVFRFDKVWFRYPGSDRYVLQDINIEIGHHEKISIVGLNGAGKTTLIKLLCRLYQPNKGTITLNGRDINSIPLKDYLQYLAIVFQDFQLLGYSVENNIAASQNPEIKRMNHVIDFFGIEKILEKLPESLDTSVNRSLDKKGVTFSGGQMQKFAIARALYKNSPVMILDEPTSTLDPKSEFEVYRNFDKLTEGKTAIYISHRLSSTRFSDRIVVFREGKIEETGTHDDLMAEEGLYSEMYSKQAQYYL